MLSFTQYINEMQQLSEALITFGGKAYPRFNNVVILAGGAGSGKGFIKEKLVGIEGYNFDVDELKLLAVRTPGLIKKIKDEMGFDISNLDPKKHKNALKDEKNVGKLHAIIGDFLELDDNKLKTLYKSILTANPERKPNLIFDVTLKDMRKLQNITTQAENLGYEKKNIHIVWIVQNVTVAMNLNKKRDRTVPPEILVNTHRGAASTIHDIVNMGDSLTRYMDGDIVFAFNRVDVEDNSRSDTNFEKSKFGGGYIKNAKYFYVKKAGKKPDLKQLTKDIRAKIIDYVPPGVDWGK